MIVILDTSIIISFLLSKHDNNCRFIVRFAQSNRIKLVASKETMSELKYVISHNHIKKLPGYKAHTVASFIAWYQYNVEYFSISDITPSRQIRDTSDTIFLKLAIVSQAEYIVSGDNDLLVLRHIQKTKIITAAEFIELQRK